jgi:hypothetical protein
MTFFAYLAAGVVAFAALLYNAVTHGPAEAAYLGSAAVVGIGYLLDREARRG